MSATFDMIVVESGLVVPELHANRQIYRDSDKMVLWESEYIDERRVILLKDHHCKIGPIIDNRTSRVSPGGVIATMAFGPSRI